MGIGDRFKRVWKGATGPSADGSAELHVGDPRFDEWPVVRDFESLADGRAWRQQLEEADVEAVLTSDWPLDDFGHGDVALRVPPGRWNEAEEALDAPDL